MDLSSLTPLEGGTSGETFLGQVAGERCVVRIYATQGDRGEAASEIDAALLRLVRGLVPVPDVLEVRRPDPATGLPGLLVTSFVPGVRGDLLLPTLDDQGLARAGHALGTVAAVLAGMPQLRPGPFLDRDLTVGTWSDHDDREVPPRCCLVHGDLDPAHVLMDADTLSVLGVTGWGGAHAGHPLSDLRRLLATDHGEAFHHAAWTAYASRHGGSPGELADRWGPPPRMDGDTPGA
jgi:hypothetical protein